MLSAKFDRKTLNQRNIGRNIFSYEKSNAMRNSSEVYKKINEFRINKLFIYNNHII